MSDNVRNRSEGVRLCLESEGIRFRIGLPQWATVGISTRYGSYNCQVVIRALKTSMRIRAFRNLPHYTTLLVSLGASLFHISLRVQCAVLQTQTVAHAWPV